MLKKHPMINVEGNTLAVYSLVNKAKRNIISKVCPIVLNDFLSTKLEKFGVKAMSQITFIRDNREPDYKHMLSFRSQVYIN